MIIGQNDTMIHQDRALLVLGGGCVQGWDSFGKYLGSVGEMFGMLLECIGTMLGKC